MNPKSKLRSLMLAVGIVLGIIIILKFTQASSLSLLSTAGHYLQELISLKK